MPELPEVETIKNDMEKKIVGREITGVDGLWTEIVKNVPFKVFSSQVKGAKITNVQRRAKNLIIHLSTGMNLLIHLKMTGHFMIAEETAQISPAGSWIKAENKDLTDDRQNQFIRIVFHLDNGKILAMSDMRKFAYIKLVDNKELDDFLGGYGPEPFNEEFTLERFQKTLAGKKTPIKKVLMDQSLIAGIGNIYADEILWAARVHPLSTSNKLGGKETKDIYENIRKILKLAIEKRGTSTSDFRDIEGKKGKFGDLRNVYRMTGFPCPVCGGPIVRISLGGRGTHFCPRCQREIK